MRTKKVGTTGRFGPRYGTKTKKIVAVIEKQQRQRQKCPGCERITLKRSASGIWNCTKCGMQIAGGAYLFESAATKLVRESFKKTGMK